MVSDVSEVASEINKKLGASLQTRPYISIYNYNGEVLHIDRNMEDFKDTLSEFIKRNFGFLKVGDHSIPFSGRNLVIFRVNDKAAVVLYTVKGYVGQLLIFNQIINDISLKLDILLIDIPDYIPPESIRAVIEREEEELKKEDQAKIYPNITKKMKKKDKFLIHEMAVLRYADGNHTVREIMAKAETSLEDVLRVLEKFTDKKKIDFNIEGEPTYVPMLIKEIPEMSLNLGIITRKELEISKLCNGKRTVEDIYEELKDSYESVDALESKLESMVKKKFIRMRFHII